LTIRLSAQRASRILRLFFSGLSQSEIAERVGVDQSTVSVYASRFRQTAREVGLMTAAKYHGLYDEIDSLRSLSVELAKADLTVEEAKRGVEMVRVLNRAGVMPDHYAQIGRLARYMDKPGFVEAAVELARVEAKGGMVYEEVAVPGRNVSPKQINYPAASGRGIRRALV